MLLEQCAHNLKKIALFKSIKKLPIVVIKVKVKTREFPNDQPSSSNVSFGDVLRPFDDG